MTQDTHHTHNEIFPLSPIKAVRKKCLDCSGGSSDEVRKCDIADCPLHPFRFGRNPYRKPRVLTEEQRAANVARLAAARERITPKEGEEYDDL